VTVNRTGVPAGNVFPKGTTTISYTATDAAGNTSAPVTQTVTVVDDTPPVLKTPPDAEYTCRSQVPAASAASASATDNCGGTPQITYAETQSGAGNANDPLVILRTWTATDGAGNTASATQTITVTDDSAPTITLNGASLITVECHTSFTDPGATAHDNCDGDFAATPSSTVDANTLGDYTVIYNAMDASGNAGQPVTRTVHVVDTTKPVIQLNGANPLVVECHTTFTDPGATASDTCGGNLTSAIVVSGSVNPNVVGDYTLTYNVTDPSGNAAVPVTRTVQVRDSLAPTITLNGANPMTVECHTGFSDPGATASDLCAGDLTSAIVVTGSVNPNVVGAYTLTYTVSDGHGQTTTQPRTVNVVDTTPPVISLSATSAVMWPPDHKYWTFNVTGFVAAVTDSCDTNLGTGGVVIEKVTSDEADDAPNGGDGNTVNDIVIAGDNRSVQLRAERDGNRNGRVYTITFKVADASGNVTRATVKVKVPLSESGAAAVDDGVAFCRSNLGACP
jgi:hypothetical protein